MTTTTLSIRVDPDLRARLEDYAAASVGGVADHVRAAIMMYLDAMNGGDAGPEWRGRMAALEIRMQKLERRVRSLDAWSNLE